MAIKYFFFCFIIYIDRKDNMIKNPIQIKNIIVAMVIIMVIIMLINFLLQILKKDIFEYYKL